MIKVVLADDQALVRSGLRMLIEASEDITVVGEASNGKELLALLGKVPADVVVMDVRMPQMDGVEATRRIVASGAPVRVLVLTTFDLDEYAFAALKAGASGFLLKDTRPDELLAAIRAVAAGGAVVAPTATRRLLDQVAGRLPNVGQSQPAVFDTLTDREREVLAEIARGATNAEIGARLFMAEGTVKTHVGRLLAKLGCRDRVGLVLIAHETGFAHT